MLSGRDTVIQRPGNSLLTIPKRCFCCIPLFNSLCVCVCVCVCSLSSDFSLNILYGILDILYVELNKISYT